jgi:Holliday junction resolvase
MAFQIIKASGQTEKFNPQKLIHSLMRSGASDEVAQEIADKVEKQITPSSHTKHIYKLARKYLKKYNRATDMRYSIKKALYALGPSGYLFEKYFARILKAYGYSVETNQFMQGHCVRHEVDVLAAKGNERFIIECKYHSNGGIPTDVKDALYIHSRYADIKKAYESRFTYHGWLVTNTRCTSDAIQYAECVGLRIISWKYPQNGSLEKMIEEKRLYPVTILSALRKSSIETLFRNGIILAQDIAQIDEHFFIKKSGLSPRTTRLLKQQAIELCPNV